MQGKVIWTFQRPYIINKLDILISISERERERVMWKIHNFICFKLVETDFDIKTLETIKKIVN